MVWNNDKVPNPNIPSRENYGWKRDNDEWLSVRMTPVKMLCRNMIMMNILMTMMKVTIAMIVQVMMMKTINVVNYVFITLSMGD